MYEHLMARNMRKLARDYHMGNVSFELMDLLDTIYVASRNGETSLEIRKNVKINIKDVKTLRLMGYDVVCTFSTSDELEENGGQLEYLRIEW